MVNVGDMIEKHGKRYTVESVNWMGQPVKLKEELLQQSDAVDSDEVEDIEENTIPITTNKVLGITEMKIQLLGKMNGNEALGRLTYSDNAGQQYFFGSILNLSSDPVLLRIESTEFDSGYSEVTLAGNGSIGSRIEISRMKIAWIFAPNSSVQVSTAPDILIFYSLVENPSESQPIAIRIY